MSAKRLTKNNTNISNTIEAFGCNCSCYCYVSCYCVTNRTSASNSEREIDIQEYKRDNGTGYGDY